MSKGGKAPAAHVLMFHGVTSALPPYATHAGGKSCLVRSDDFERVVRWCAERYRFLKVSELDDYLAGEDREPAMVLTFDDAHASVVDLALPVLRQLGACATVFVTTGWTDGAKSPTIFQLERALWERRPRKATIRSGERQLDVRLGSPRDLPDAMDRIWNFLFATGTAPLSLSAEAVTMDGAAWSSDGVTDDRHFWFPATWQELRSAVAEGIMEVGSHGVTHTPWTWLSTEALRVELEASRDRIRAMLGGAVESCSYPHGLTDDRVAAQTGQLFRWAFTNVRGVVSHVTPRALAPRYHIPAERPVHMHGIVTLPRAGAAVRRLGALIGGTR